MQDSTTSGYTNESDALVNYAVTSALFDSQAEQAASEKAEAAYADGQTPYPGVCGIGQIAQVKGLPLSELLDRVWGSLKGKPGFEDSKLAQLKDAIPNSETVATVKWLVDTLIGLRQGMAIQPPVQPVANNSRVRPDDYICEANPNAYGYSVVGAAPSKEVLSGQARSDMA